MFGGFFLDLDKTDVKILEVLDENARLSVRKIAARVGVSPVTVLNRIKRIENAGIIKKYSAQLDYDKLDYEQQAIIELRVSNGKHFEVEKKIASNPNVCAVYDVTGEYDSMVIARFKNRKSLDSFIKNLQIVDFVEKTYTRMILNTIKED